MSSKIISAIALALPLSHAMPSISPDNGKIVGGELAETGEFPFLVSLQGPGLCGGGLLDAQTIITAAHCFEPDTNTPEEFQARAGSNVRFLRVPVQ